MSLQLAAKCISKTQIISHPRSIPFSKETKLASCHQYFPLLNPYEINRLFIILSKQQCQKTLKETSMKYTEYTYKYTIFH